MKERLGTFDRLGLVFAEEALEAAGIEYVLRDDSPRNAVPIQRMDNVPELYDLLVEAERLADAKLAVERWRKEAEEAGLRESGAPLPDADELAADAEWERQKLADRARRSSPIWPGLVIMLVATGGGLLVWWLLAGR